MGSYLVYDMRMLHAGGENKSDKRRTMACLSYVNEWFFDQVNFEHKQTKSFKHDFTKYMQKMLTRQDRKAYIRELEDGMGRLEALEARLASEEEVGEAVYQREEL